jgi:3-hydroxyisobutyrate dehydrogenase-like beta-hydroxyacid dehydrogenase
MLITLLGLGRMGHPTAVNLIAAGHQVTLYDRNRGRAEALAGKNVRAAETVAEAVRGNRVILSMVSDDQAERALTFDSNGLLERMDDGAIHLCMSTISPETSRRLAAAHGKARQGYVAAPVLGNPAAAAAHRLWILAAGPETQVNRCLPVLEALSQGITRVGTQPAVAHALKLGADALAATLVETLSEVLSYGQKAGYPPGKYMQILNGKLFKSPLMDSLGGFIVRGDHKTSSQNLDLSATGVEMLLQASSALQVEMPLIGTLLQQMREAQARGFGGMDLTALALLAGQKAQLAPPPAQRPAEPEPEPAPEPVPAPEPEPAPAPEPAPPPPPVPTPEPAPEPHPAPQPEPGSEPQTDPLPAEQASYPALAEEGTVMLDLWQTTHFEWTRGAVWAWVDGRRYSTFWLTLDEVERALKLIRLVRIQRRILLSPHAILTVRARFGGRGSVSVAGGVNLAVSRAGMSLLKFLM